VGRRDELTDAAGVGNSRLAREALGLAEYRLTRWVAATETGWSVPRGALAEFAGRCGPDPLRRVQEVVDALVADEPPAFLQRSSCLLPGLVGATGGGC
jgi:hypothetical protein